jgi:hypothetical protein
MAGIVSKVIGKGRRTGPITGAGDIGAPMDRPGAGAASADDASAFVLARAPLTAAAAGPAVVRLAASFLLFFGATESSDR